MPAGPAYELHDRASSRPIGWPAPRPSCWKISLSELLLVNAIIAALAVVSEIGQRARRSVSAPLLYDRLDLLRLEDRAKLLTDLKERTGFEVTRVDIVRIDLLRDAAELTIHYTEVS